jgi:hypothetical protein
MRDLDRKKDGWDEGINYQFALLIFFLQALLVLLRLHYMAWHRKRGQLIFLFVAAFIFNEFMRRRRRMVEVVDCWLQTMG